MFASLYRFCQNRPLQGRRHDQTNTHHRQAMRRGAVRGMLPSWLEKLPAKQHSEPSLGSNCNASQGAAPTASTLLHPQASNNLKYE